MRAGRWPTRCRSAPCRPATGRRRCPTCWSPRAGSASPLGEPVEDARAALEAAVADACADDPWLRDHPVEVEWWGGQFASGRLPADSDLVDRVRGRPRVAGGGAPPTSVAAPYGSDLRLLTGLGGIPTLQYGPGDARSPTAPTSTCRSPRSSPQRRALALLVLDVCGIAE